MSALPDQIEYSVRYHLVAIAHLFSPGVKVTLLIRNGFGAGQPDDIVWSNDTFPEAIAGLERRQRKEEGTEA